MSTRTALLVALATCIVLGGQTAEASFPRLITYQGVITDSAGVPITANGVSIRYLMYPQEVGGNFFWAEVTQVDVVDGQVTHLLGSITDLPDTMFTAFDSLWLEILVNGEALIPRILMTPAPYSMRVETIDQATGGDVFGDVWIHSVLTVGDFMGSNGEILVYDGNLATIHMQGGESAVEGSDITLRKTNTRRSIEIDAEEDNVGHIRLYHQRTGGGEVETVDIAASANGATGGQILLSPIEGPRGAIELNAEYLGPGAEGRIGVNAKPDSGTVHVAGSQQVTGFLTNSYNGSFAKVLYAKYLGNSTSDVIGVWGEAWPSDGNGRGGFFRGGEHGVSATAEGGDATFTCSALEGFAYGDPGAGTRYGVYAIAQGGEVGAGVYGFSSTATTNWGGYFVGTSYMGSLAIGTAFNGATSTNFQPPPGYKLAVDGKVICEEVEVLLSDDWPDYVFKPDYDLMPLDELESAIQTHGHLPNVPSAEEVAAEGIALGEMQATLLEKVEELNLYVIQLNKDLKQIRQENQELRTLIAKQGGQD